MSKTRSDEKSKTQELARVEISGEIQGTDIERLVLVGGDLGYLMELPRDRLLTHTEVRLCASVLRRLLIDNQLGLLWKSLGAPSDFKPVIRATDIDSVLEQWPDHWLFYGWAGGAPANGANHRGMLLWTVPEADWKVHGSYEAFIDATELPSSGEPTYMPVSRWQESTAVALGFRDKGTLKISRAEVVKYLANRKGGVHFDPKRRLDASRTPKRLREEKYRLLDHGFIRVGHLTGPEYEIASMAHAIAESDWAAELVRIAKEAAPDDFDKNASEIKFWTGLQEADGTGWATMTFPGESELKGD